MSLWKIAWRSIQQRALASTLTGISMALGVALVVAVLVIHGVIAASFHNNSSLGYNLIVTAKGGKLQAVLNTVYYLSSPVQNIPYSYYKKFTEGEFAPYVAHAVPVCLGDYFLNFRVVGTTPEMFDGLEYANGKKYQFSSGRNFKQSEFFAAVVGSTVASEAELKVGDEIHPSHGVPDGHKHDPFTVKGILAPTGTPNDRAVFVNMEGFYLLEGHAEPLEEGTAAQTAEKHAEAEHAEDHPEHTEDDHAEAGHDDAEGDTEDHKHAHDEKHADDHEHKHDEHADGERDGQEHAEGKKNAAHDHDHDAHDKAHGEHEHANHEHADHHEHGHHHHAPLPESQRKVTAVLIAMRSIAGAPPELYAAELVRRVDTAPVAQAILPVREVTMLFDDLVRPIQIVLIVLTVLIVIVSGIGILVSIYNSMSDRRHEIAVMRALGAGRRTVMLIVLFESILLSLAGGLVGWLLGHALTVALNPWVTPRTGVSMDMFQFVEYELVIIPGLILLASLVGYLPAMAAYRTDVAKSLTAAP